MVRAVLRALLAISVTVAAVGCSGGGSSVPAGSSSLSAAADSHPVVGISVGLTPPSASPAVALSDDFSADAIGGPATGWSVASGTWSVCPAGTTHAYCQTAATASIAFNGASWWSDYTIDAQVVEPNVSYGGAAIIGRAVNPNAFYQFELRPQYNASQPFWYLLKYNNGTYTTLGSGPLRAPDKTINYHLRLAFSGSQISASVAFNNGTPYRALTTVTDSSYPAGQVGLRTWGTTANKFANILVSLTSSVLPSERAVSASAFVDSMGMNAHFESPFYFKRFPQVRTLIANLGIRHYRVSAGSILAGGNYVDNLTTLNTSLGVKFDVLADLHTTPKQVAGAIAQLPPGSVDSVEGPNESDNPGQGSNYDANFATDVPAYMRSLYTTFKLNSLTSQIAIYGPTFINSTSYAAVGDISSSVDAGNMHNYFGGFSPGTLGWGGGGYGFAPRLNYGSIDWNMESAQQASGTKPLVTTETGYYTAPIHSAVPLDVQAKYMPRLYLEQYRHHVARTFMYQLIGYDMTSQDGTLDIVSPAYVVSPAYNALAGMIGVLNDGTAMNVAANYSWGLTGQAMNVDHVLIHKADGTLILPLWIEAPSFDPNANGGQGARITVPAQTVTVNVAQMASTGVVWTCNAQSGTWTSNPVTLTNGAVSISVTDSVSILVVGR